MSQWGTEKTANGARFIPHVESQPFNPISDSSLIKSIALIDDGGNNEMAKATYTELTQEFCGKPYALWQEQPNIELRRNP